MKALILTISLLLTSACAPAHVSMPSDIQGYYEEYFQIVGVDKQRSGNIVMGKPGDGHLALCQALPLFDWVITVDAEAWDHIPDDWKRTVIFHELTHCTFESFGHSEDPASFMYFSPRPVTHDTLNSQVVDYVKNHL